MIGKDVMGLQSRQQWGPEIQTTWHTTSNRLNTPTVVKKNSDLLERYWGRRFSLSISHFKVPVYKRQHCHLASNLRVPQVQLLGLSFHLRSVDVFLSPFITFLLVHLHMPLPETSLLSDFLAPFSTHSASAEDAEMKEMCDVHRSL